MIGFLVKRPIAVFTLTFSILVLGTYSVFKVPTSIIPDIEIPQMMVHVSYPNSSAEELEANIIKNLREELLLTGGLSDIESQTKDGYGQIKMFFNYGTDIDFALIEANDRLDRSMQYLPNDLKRPRLIKASPSDVPISYLTVSLRNETGASSFFELSEFVEKNLKRRIEQLPQVALADISGHAKNQIVISPDFEKLQSLGISLKTLENAIQQNNFESDNFFIQNGSYIYNLSLENTLKSVDDLREVYLYIHDKRVKLKDLANIKSVSQESDGSVFINGRRSIVLAIIKQSDSKLSKLEQELRQLTEALEEEYDHIKFESIQDQSLLLKLSIGNLKDSLIIGGSLAILILFFFIKDFMSPMIIALSIPISLALTFILLHAIGLSINIISLSGIILGVGMMIDNSIIVIDSISKVNDTSTGEGRNIAYASDIGVRQVVLPLFTSALTTCSVFLPLVFSEGLAGALFFDQAISISIGLFSSLLVSIFLIPVIYVQLKSIQLTAKNIFNSNTSVRDINSIYLRGYDYFLANPKILIYISVTSTIIGFFLFYSMKYSELPILSQNETVLTLDWNDNISLAENEKRVELLLDEISDLNTSFIEAGRQNFLLKQDNLSDISEVSIYLKAIDHKTMNQIIDTLRGKIRFNYPRAIYNFSPPKTIFEYVFGTRQKDLVAEVYLRNSNSLPDLNKLSTIDSLFTNIDKSTIPLKKTIIIRIDYEKLIRYGVNHEDLTKELNASFNDISIDNLRGKEKFIPIRLSYPIKSIESSLSNMFIINKNGDLIRVRDLISIVESKRYEKIYANANGPFLKYRIEENDKVDNSSLIDITKNFFDMEELGVRFSEEKDAIKKARWRIFFSISISVLLLYLILAVQFESLLLPLIVLIEIPIDIGGGLLLLWVFGGTINIMAGIGLIVTIGIIINDSILKIHTINELRRKGLPTRQAAKEGSQLRLRPIVMTSLTTILALIPYLFIGGLGSELQRPLALTVIGGMIIGTFISLYFIPYMYTRFVK
ncbi:MAG: efflux RND transporter permease subunit [Bacteroidota bacterium]